MALALSVIMTLASFNLCVPCAFAEEEADDGIFLDINYDDKTQAISDYGNDFTKSTEKGSDGYYLNVSTNWTQSGYILKKPIPSDGDDYNLNFDFSITKPGGGYYLLMLSERETEKGDDTYHQFGVLSAGNEGEIKVAGTYLSDIKWEADKWYSYKMTFNRKTRKINVTVTEKGNEENTSSASFNAPVSTTYGNGLPDRKYDVLKFSAGGGLKIDNILLEESREKPLLVTGVKSEHAGNVFALNDVKTLEVGVKNALTNPVTAQIKYTVRDDDGNIADSGSVSDISAAAREVQTVPVTVNLTKYNTYRIYFDVTATDTKTNEKKEYSTEGYMLSVANKKSKSDKPNKYTAANTEYIYTESEWKPIEELLIQSGISAIRKEISWGHVEIAEGKYINPDYTFYLQELHDDGIDYLAIISPNNSRYAGNYDRMRVDQMDADGIKGIWEAWEKHLEYIAQQYGDKVKYYEIFNEPNERVSVEIYAKYLEIAYRAIKKYDPDGIVVGFSTASMPWTWIEQMLAIVGKDPGKYLDAISIHPYDFDYGEYRTKSKSASLAWSTLFRDQYFIEKNDRMKALMEKYGCGDIPVLGTEIGMTSTPLVYSTKQQAADMMQMFAVNQVSGIMDRVWIYCFENTWTRGMDDYSLRDTEDNFGIVGNRNDTVPLAAKPSYIALCAYNKMMTDAEFIDEIVNNPTRAYRFRRPDGKQVIMLWSENSSENIALNIGADSVEIYDQYSNNVASIQSASGIYDFTATFEPIYIVGNFDKMERAESTIEIDNGRINAVLNDMCTFNVIDKLGRNLRIEASSTPYAIVEENNGIEGGKGKVVVKTTEDAFQEEPVEIRVYDGNRLLFYSRVHIVVGDEGISIKYDLGSDPNAPERNVVNVSVTNKTAGTTLSGAVNADFSKVGGKLEERTIVDLEPGKTKTVYMNVPKTSYIKSIGAPLKVSFGGAYDIERNISVINPMTVNYNSTGKTGVEALNGDLSNSQQFAANDALAASSIENWGGPEDCSLKSTLRWDENNLYIYAEVTDDIFYQDKEKDGVWEADGLQLGIQDISAVDPTDTSFTEIAVSKTKNGVEVWRFTNQNGVSNQGGAMKAEYADIELLHGKAVYKMAFPWSELIGRETVSAGESFRFNISANENDGGGRRGWVEVTEGICGTKNAQLFGTIRLEK